MHWVATGHLSDGALTDRLVKCLFLLLHLEAKFIIMPRGLLVDSEDPESDRR